MKKTILFMLMLALSMIPFAALADTPQTMYVTTQSGSGVHMRSSPDTTADNIIMTVPYGAAVQVNTIMADAPFANVTYEGQTGYMEMDYLSTTPPSSTPKTMYVTAESGVHMRTAPDTSVDNIIMTVPYGAAVHVNTIMADAPFVDATYDGQTGYIEIDYLSYTKPSGGGSSGGSGSSGSSTLQDELADMFTGFVTTNYQAVVTPTNEYVNLRWAPSLSAPVRGEYLQGATLQVLSQNGTWSEVFDASGNVYGYMESQFLVQQQGATESTSGQGQG